MDHYALKSALETLEKNNPEFWDEIVSKAIERKLNVSLERSSDYYSTEQVPTLHWGFKMISKA